MAAPTWVESQILDTIGTSADTTSAGGIRQYLSGDTANVVIPAGAAENDIAFLYVHTDDYTTASSTPADWNPCGDDVSTSSGGGGKARLFWKRLGASEGGTNVSVTWGSSGSSTQLRLGKIFLVRGAITTGTPYEDYLTTVVGSAATLTTNAAGTTTTGPDRLLIRIYSIFDNPNSADISAWSPPGSWDYRIGCTTSGGSDGDFAVDTYVQSTADTVAATSRTGAASTACATFSLAVIPASGASAVAGISRHYARMMNG